MQKQSLAVVLHVDVQSPINGMHMCYTHSLPYANAASNKRAN